MEYKLSQLKKFKQVTLNEEERGIIRAHIARVMMEPPRLVTQSLFQRGVTHGLRIALSSMLFIIFVGGSVSAVADNALPGDPLYSFKINVNEEIKGLFLKTPEERVVWQKNRIENRVSEIKTLASTKTLTKAKQATVQKALDSHVAELSANLATLSDESPNAALNVTASLEESLKAEKAAIAGTTTVETSTTADANPAAMKKMTAAPVIDDATADALKTVDDTLAKVSKQEEAIVAREIDKIGNDITGDDTDLDDLSTSAPAPSTPVEP